MVVKNDFGKACLTIEIFLGVSLLGTWIAVFSRKLLR